MKTLEKAWRIVEYVRAMGNDARDVRDAAHEAHHALDAPMKNKPWTRDNIHYALEVKANAKARAWGRSPSGMAASMMISYELDARAVEKIVCNHIGIEYDDDHWTHVAWMETLHSMRIALPTDFFEEGLRTRLRVPRVHTAAQAIIALAELPIPSARRATRSRR